MRQQLINYKCKYEEDQHKWTNKMDDYTIKLTNFSYLYIYIYIYSVHLDDLIRENLKMKKQISFMDKKYAEEMEEKSLYQNNFESLRTLSSALVNDLNTEKAKDIRNTKLWQALEVDNLLFQSEPPVDFTLPQQIDDRNALILREETLRLQREVCIYIYIYIYRQK